MDKERKRWCFQTDTHGKSDERVKRGGVLRAAFALLLTTSRISNLPVFVQFTICDEGQLAKQSSEKRQRIYNCNSKYFSRGPMIKFISFCPKMINSADFVIPTTIMPTQ